MGRILFDRLRSRENIMSELHNIKDSTPNETLIRQLEAILKDAKSGELRSVIWICGWNDDSVTHGWATDGRSSLRRILAELVLLQHDFVDNIGFKEGDTVLARAFDID